MMMTILTSALQTRSRQQHALSRRLGMESLAIDINFAATRPANRRLQSSGVDLEAERCRQMLLTWARECSRSPTPAKPTTMEPTNVTRVIPSALPLTAAKSALVHLSLSVSEAETIQLLDSYLPETTPNGPKIVLTVGEPLEIKCEAFGEPDPEVEWVSLKMSECRLQRFAEDA